MNSTGRTALPNVAQRRVLDVPVRGRFVIWDAGPPTAPAVFLLHGATLTAELNWSGVVGPLAEHYRVVTLDLRNHGEGPRRGRFRLEDCADDVAAIAGALGIEQLVPAGFSMGGFIAQLLWRRHPDLVRGLVLCSTSRNICGSPWERTVALMLPGAIATAAWSPAFYPFGADTLGASLLDHDLDPEARAWALARMRRMTLLDALVALEVGAAFTSHDWVSAIDVPTACVVTVRDRVVAPRRQYKLAGALADNTTIEIDADHGAFLSSPDQFAAAVTAACDAVCGVSDARWTRPDDLAS
jgi:3-oxoadipate enol-lactonase